MEAPRKLASQGPVAAAVHPGAPGRLGLLADSTSGTHCLIDCGSVYSILPHKSTSQPSGLRIMAADRTPIPCWGLQREQCTWAATASSGVFSLLTWLSPSLAVISWPSTICSLISSACGSYHAGEAALSTCWPLQQAAPLRPSVYSWPGPLPTPLSFSSTCNHLRL